MNEAMNLRVRVKPVFFQLIHSGPYERAVQGRD